MNRLVGHRKILLKKLFNLMIGNTIVRQASKIIVLSHYETQQLTRYPVNKQKIVVIPNGISSPDDSELGEKETPIEEPYFLYIGRLESRKNLLFLLKAFAKYLSRGGTAHLVCVGPVERDYDKQVRDKSVKLNIEKNVHILPPVYGLSKWKYMKSSLAVLYPSYGEPFGRVPFEAISVGAFTIVPNASGAAEYLRDFLKESIYCHDDVDSLTEALHFHENTDERRGDLEKARAWINQELSWTAITQKVLNLYKEIHPQKVPGTFLSSIAS